MNNIFNYNLLKHLVKIVAGITILFFVNSLVGFSLDVTEFFDKNDMQYIFIAQVFFLLSFFLKFQRLAIITKVFEKDNVKSSMRNLFSIHIFSSALALILPFKLGDIARVFLLSKNNINYDYSSSIVIVLVERLLDLLIVVVLLVIVGTMYKYLDGIDGMEMNTRILIAVLIFVAVYVLIFTLKFWHEILTSNNFVSLTFIAKVIENILYMLNLVKHLFRKNGFKLLLFTIVIWIFEACAFTSIYIYFDVELSLLMFLGFISFLAFALPAGPVGYGAIHLVFYYALQSKLLSSDLIADGLYYSTFVYIPALLCFGFLWLMTKTIRGA